MYARVYAIFKYTQTKPDTYVRVPVQEIASPFRRAEKTGVSKVKTRGGEEDGGCGDMGEGRAEFLLRPCIITIKPFHRTRLNKFLPVLLPLRQT